MYAKSRKTEESGFSKCLHFIYKNDYNIHRYELPIDGQPEYFKQLIAVRVFEAHGRLFLWFIIIFASDGISKSEGSKAQAQQSYHSLNGQHWLSPPFRQIPRRVSIVIGGSQSLRRGLTAYRVWQLRYLLYHRQRMSLRGLKNDLTFD